MFTYSAATRLEGEEGEGASEEEDVLVETLSDMSMSWV